MSQLATFDEMSLEAIGVACQSAFEECESVFRAIDGKQKQLEIFGRLLTAAKAKVAHGEWENWLTDTFEGRLKLRTAQLWMSKAQKVALLESGQQPQVVPRAERKTGRVEVVKADRQQAAQTDDNAVQPEPKTNTKHRPETAKSKEADRPVPAAVTPEIVEEPKYDRQAWDDSPEPKTLADFAVTQIYEFLIESADDAKKRAKELRKIADKLDPPTKFVKPTVEDVAEYCRERNNSIDAETFVAHYAANGWKLANGNKLNDWKSAVITWEKRHDSGNKQSGGAIAGTGRIKPGKIDESQIEWR